MHTQRRHMKIPASNINKINIISKIQMNIPKVPWESPVDMNVEPKPHASLPKQDE